MKINGLQANWETYLFYALVLAITGAGAYFKLLDPSLFAVAVTGVIANGVGQAQAKSSLVASGAITSAAPATGAPAPAQTYSVPARVDPVTEQIIAQVKASMTSAAQNAPTTTQEQAQTPSHA